MKKLLFIVLFIALGCEKETDLISDYITVSVNVSKIKQNITPFPDGKAGKGCEFPDTITSTDSNTYYLTFESLDTGDIQKVEVSDSFGSFEITHYGNNYKLTTSTFNGTELPDMDKRFYWYSEQILDLSVTPDIEVLLNNQYSAVVVINNDNSIQGTPQLNGQEMYINENGWYIYTKLTGPESLRIQKTSGEFVDYEETYDPYTIYSYMYCDPLSLKITREDTPFTLDKQTIFN